MAPARPALTARLSGLLRLGATASLLAAALPAPATESQADRKGQAGETGQPEAEAGEQAGNPVSGLAAIAKIIPIGHEQKSVVVPNYSNTRISSLIRAAGMKRLDDQRLALTEVTITTYDDEENEEMIVKMPTAIYHLESAILEGTSRSTVSRADFDLLGDGLLFDSGNNFGRMQGNLHMTIKDDSIISIGGETNLENQPAETSQP